MAHAENEVVLERPGAAVYAFLADLENVSAWLPAVEHVELVGGTAGVVGAEYAATVEVGGVSREGRVTITRLEPPTGIGVSVVASPLRIDGDVSIHDRGDRSRIAVVLDAPTTGLLRLVDGAIEQALRDALDGLSGLADAIPPAG